MMSTKAINLPKRIRYKLLTYFVVFIIMKYILFELNRFYSDP